MMISPPLIVKFVLLSMPSAPSDDVVMLNFPPFIVSRPSLFIALALLELDEVFPPHPNCGELLVPYAEPVVTIVISGPLPSSVP